MKKSGIRAAIVAVLMLITGVSTAGYASAAPASQSSWAQRDSRAAVRHLSTSAAADLQRQINDTLRTTKGGVQVSANEIAYKGSGALLSLPLPGQRTAPENSQAALALFAPSAAKAAPNGTVYYWGCPQGDSTDNQWYCFYEDANMGGRRLQWNLQHCGTDYEGIFANYGFTAQASSWVNTGPLYVWAQVGSSTLWVENPDEYNKYVGDEDNDLATGFTSC